MAFRTHKETNSIKLWESSFQATETLRNCVKNMFCNKSLPNVKSIAHGKENEKVARSIYSNKVQTKVAGFTVFDAGISVNPECPFVGTTPDGKVYDTVENPPYGLVEIKCPFSKRNDTAIQAALDRNCYLEDRNGSLSLKVNHSSGYYCQVQGQLAITGLTWCDFCVYFSNSNEMVVERIHWDKDYWRTLLFPKLSNFYVNYVLPYIVAK